MSDFAWRLAKLSSGLKTPLVHLFSFAPALAGRAVRHVRRRAVRWLARLYRPALRRPVFIGVTGSGGKTAAKDLIAAVLACRFEGRKGPDSKNDQDSIDARWTEEEGALLARAEWRGEAVWFVKPLTSLNATGSALLRLADRLGFDATACTLVHDDLDLPLGTVRARMSGSAGGLAAERALAMPVTRRTAKAARAGLRRAADSG